MSRRIAWFGYLSLGLAACSGSEAPDTMSNISAFGPASGRAGSGSTPDSEMEAPAGEPGAEPVSPSTSESGPAPTGGLLGTEEGASAGSGSSNDAGTEVAPPLALDAGLPPPTETVEPPPVDPAVPPPVVGTPVRCDNLALAPNTTGVPQPAGAVGGLRVLDWAGFRGAASFTFDDNTPSQMDSYAQLRATGGRFTWFVVGNFIGNNAAEIARFRATIADGMEVGNHTFSHGSAGSLPDLTQNQNFINTNFGVTANSMAAPNCAAAWATVAPNLLFQNRGPCGQPINTIRAGAADATNPFAIPAYLPAANESAATMSAALVDGQWRVYVIHGFDNRNGTFQPIPIGNVTGAISTAVSRGYWVEGMTNIGAYWQGQKLISAAATTNATWTKPARFPANMCLRITTTGGTVTQNGQVIPWNDRGYYEIGLDAGEVTIR